MVQDHVKQNSLLNQLLLMNTMLFPCNKGKNVIKRTLLSYCSHSIIGELKLIILACYIMYQIPLCIYRTRVSFHIFSLIMRFGILALCIILTIQPPSWLFCLTGVSGRYLEKCVGIINISPRILPVTSQKVFLIFLAHMFFHMCPIHPSIDPGGAAPLLAASELSRT